MALCVCVLSACGGKKQEDGRIVEMNMDGEAGLVSFIMQTDERKETGVLVTDETQILSLVEGIDADDFRAGRQKDVLVSVHFAGGRRTISTQDGEKIRAYQAEIIEITGCLKTDTVALSDGTTANIRKYEDAFDGVRYLLPDGTELLRVQAPTGPADSFVGGVEGLCDLEKAAQEKILQYFTDQGLLYDEQAELEKAYNDYLETEDASTFQTHTLKQDTTPASSNSEVIYFLISALLPADGSHYEYRIGAAFDKNTGGGQIENWELFSCPPEETVQTLLDIAGITEPVLREEMEQAFAPEYMIFFPENLEIYFPQGTLPSQEYSYILGLDYDERLLGILHAWAVPEQE